MHNGKAGMSSMTIADLPEAVLHDIFSHLDVLAICSAAQTCRSFLKMAGNPKWWRNSHRVTEDKLMTAARLCLSRALHLPPQIFQINDDSRRSTAFPLSVHFSHLRGVLAIPHMEEVVATACHEISGQIKRTKSSKGGLLAQAGGPAALFCLVRPERASVRFSLSTPRALSAILQGFGELGWPEVTEEMSFARMPELNWDHGRLSVVRRLFESAQQCIKAAELPEGALSRLESWLGPSEALAAHGTQKDMELMLVLRQYLLAEKVLQNVSVNGYPNYGGLARAVLAAFQSHSVQSGPSLMPSASMSGPNGLAELATHARHPPVSGHFNTAASSGCSRQEPCGPDDGGSMHRTFTGAEVTPDRQSAGEGNLGSLTGVGAGMDPDLTLIAKQRLKARLHLEVLRVLHWCFHLLALRYQT